MCGHGTIAICTVLVEMGMIEAQQPEIEIVLDTLAGLVQAKVAVMAVLHTKGKLGFKELVHESILGTLILWEAHRGDKSGTLSRCSANHHWHPAVCPRSRGLIPCWVPLGQEGQTVGRWIGIRSMD
jgi:hypothetical protein